MVKFLQLSPKCSLSSCWGRDGGSSIQSRSTAYFGVPCVFSAFFNRGPSCLLLCFIIVLADAKCFLSWIFLILTSWVHSGWAFFERVLHGWVMVRAFHHVTSGDPQCGTILSLVTINFISSRTHYLPDLPIAKVSFSCAYLMHNLWGTTYNRVTILFPQKRLPDGFYIHS